MINYPEPIIAAVASHPYPLLFATVSGAHLYGFPSPDSDWDLRGVHVLPVSQLIGFDVKDETVEVSKFENGVELDLVSHDIKKFFSLMLKKNGYVLEQLYSPLVVHSTAEHQELMELGKSCITRHHAHHYLGFSLNQWKLFEKETPPRVKPLLYVYRVLLTGIHLMRTGVIEANLVTLNREFKLSFIDELIARKVGTQEKERLSDVDLAFHELEYLRLRGRLEHEASVSKLPEVPTAKPALEDLLIRVRLKRQPD